MIEADHGTGGRSRTPALTLPQLRLASGLVLFAFALLHFLNHALGLVSLEAMETAQDLRTAVTRSLPGTAILILAAAVHFGLGILRFVRARTWRMGMRSIVQLVFGLLIPVFLIAHVWQMRGAHEILGIDTSYSYALWALWPGGAWNQAILMLLVWVHACIGLHHWLATDTIYRRFIAVWYAGAVLVPALGFAGFVTAARAARLRGGYANPFRGDGYGGDLYAPIAKGIATSQNAYALILGIAVLVWLALVLADRLRPRVAVRYAGGQRILAPRGMTLLEISRNNRIPHASVCGGRARCSTCRVRVTEGLAGLSPPTEVEAAVLRRVGAPPNVRLACQLRPTADIAISTLLPAHVKGVPGGPSDRYHWGVEQDVTILFCDLRGFTRMSEGKLPFDVVFLLNQFLGRMAEVIEDSGGHVDKFMGDGIMAIFGMDAPVAEGARAAMAAARAMDGVLGALNQSMRDELPAPLAMGVGLHTGPAILGRIGAAQRTEAAALTALGETVNLASRLESLTKDVQVQVIVSAACLAASGLAPTPGMRALAVEVRGISRPVDVFAAAHAGELPVALATAAPARTDA